MCFFCLFFSGIQPSPQRGEQGWPIEWVGSPLPHRANQPRRQAQGMRQRAGLWLTLCTRLPALHHTTRTPMQVRIGSFLWCILALLSFIRIIVYNSRMVIILKQEGFCYNFALDYYEVNYFEWVFSVTSLKMARLNSSNIWCKLT